LRHEVNSYKALHLHYFCMQLMRMMCVSEGVRHRLLQAGYMGALLREASRNLSGTVRLEAVQVRKSQQSDGQWVVYEWMYGSPLKRGQPEFIRDCSFGGSAGEEEPAE